MLKKIGIWVLVYSIICAGIINYSLWFGLALGVGGSGIFYKFNTAVNSIFNILDVLLPIGILAGFLLTLIGSICLMSNKIGGKKISVWGIFLSIAGSLLGVMLTFICCIYGFDFFYDFLPIAIMAAIITSTGILLNKKLKQI